MEGGIGHVAIIDDDPAVLASLGLMLEVAGYRVAAYGSANAFLTEDMPEPDCLILDHYMPGITGLELATRLRTGGARVPVLLITGGPSASLFLRAEELGIEEVLEKPLKEDDILHFVAAFSRPS